MESTTQVQSQPSKFDKLVQMYELNPKVASQLKEVLSTCEIVLVCDDSGSMSSKVVEPGQDPTVVNQVTRWSELKKLAAEVIKFVTAINETSGLDLYFLNRGIVKDITDISGLQSVFADPPSGGTPLIGTLRKVYNDKKDNLNGKKLLIVVVTDGEPTDCDMYDESHSELYNLLTNITRRGDIHISFAECTDNEEAMDYLDNWDGQIKNFDNTDDFREELVRVKRSMGQNFKFDYTDYVVKILLATFVRWYFDLDQKNQIKRRREARNENDECCLIL